MLAATDQGIEFVGLSAETGSQPPLSVEQVLEVYRLGREAERHFGTPQDMEWTFCDGRLYLLQSRPVTTPMPASGGDQRAWYLSLHRSFENLKGLRQKIEGEQIPAMIRVAELSRCFLEAFPDSRRMEGVELLDLARASYRLRDDDNIYLGRIEAQLVAAVAEGRRRLILAETADAGRMELRAAGENLDFGSRMRPAGPPAGLPDGRVQPRQLTGQPAGPGVAQGTARVVCRHADLEDFVHGEVLVCDTVDPNRDCYRRHGRTVKDITLKRRDRPLGGL